MDELSITIAGNVCSNVTATPTDGSGSWVSFRVAHNERRFDPQTREWTDGQPQFFTVQCRGRLAENVAACVKVGMPVVVRGRLQVKAKEYTGADGAVARRTFVDVHAQHVGIDIRRGVVEYAPRSAAVDAAQRRALADAEEIIRRSA